MWSRAWLLPALPGRKVIANNSVVLSHHTPIGRDETRTRP
jgi:hypothetical protein